ncbi:HNH endonuclease [Ruania alkalisoli]|uniref:HNH endonuclease n=1 Tax=Ruania alkalisoli TaxID=2779775 RepID=A0A7M1SQ01_9MICO|nr:HNH endonuclease signature motif containing protein [Ruania alkalisoli]QOR69545.1 HNH endonuclease [Ruania alkalisoli]
MTSTATGSAFSASAERDVLAAVRENRAAARAVEIECAELVVSWVAERAVEPGEDGAGAVGVYDPEVDIDLPGSTVPGMEEPMRLAGQGAPWVSDLGFARLAATLGQSNEAALSYVGAVVEVAYRLPALWGRVRAGQVSFHRARAVARLTRKLPFEGAGWVDRQVAWSIGSCSRAQIERAVAAAMDHYDPEQARAEAQAALEARRVEIHLGDAGDPHVPGSTAVVNFEGGLDLADALDLEAAVAARAAALKTLMPDASEDVRRSIALGDLARGKATLPPAATADAPGGSAVPGDSTRACVTEPARAGAPTGPAETTGDPTATGTTGPEATGRTVMLYLHLRADALDQHGRGVVGRCENTRSPVTVEQVRSWCGSAGRVLVRPVIDLNDQYSATTYEASPRLREQVILRDQRCRFPFCPRSARTGDVDHITPHEQGGPTSSRNLAVLCRRHHRVKTHTDWTYELLSPGTYYWTGPDRVAYLVSPAGTFVLPGVISTPGQPVIKTRRIAIASMRANARAMPTRRHQVRPAAELHPSSSSTDPPPF